MLVSNFYFSRQFANTVRLDVHDFLSKAYEYGKRFLACVIFQIENEKAETMRVEIEMKTKNLAK